MENRKIAYYSKNCNLKLSVYPGHYSTRHSHVNYFLDMTTIKDELDKTKSLASIGGIEYLAKIVESVSNAANLDYYIGILKEKMIVYTLKKILF